MILKKSKRVRVSVFKCKITYCNTVHFVGYCTINCNLMDGHEYHKKTSLWNEHEALNYLKILLRQISGLKGFTQHVLHVSHSGLLGKRPFRQSLQHSRNIWRIICIPRCFCRWGDTQQQCLSISWVSGGSQWHTTTLSCTHGEWEATETVQWSYKTQI
jgi:hypothetical protein